MFEEAEQRVTELEAALRGPVERRKVVYLPGVVEACLRDLKGSLEIDPDEAGSLLARLIGHVTLRRKDDRPVAELRGSDYLFLMRRSARFGFRSPSPSPVTG